MSMPSFTEKYGVVTDGRIVCLLHDTSLTEMLQTTPLKYLLGTSKI
jgi:hypothetical protein